MTARANDMTAREALESAKRAEPGLRLGRYEAICGPRGDCQRQALTEQSGRWTFCPDCLTVYDDYGKSVNQIAEFGTIH